MEADQYTRVIMLVKRCEPEEELPELTTEDTPVKECEEDYNFPYFTSGQAYITQAIEDYNADVDIHNALAKKVQIKKDVGMEVVDWLAIIERRLQRKAQRKALK